MLLDLYHSAGDGLQALGGLIAGSIVLEGLTVVLVPWILWYVYEFSTKPLLNPHSPKELLTRFQVCDPVTRSAKTFYSW
jgi:hypothetical protein